MRSVKISATGTQSKRKAAIDKFAVPSSGTEADKLYSAEVTSVLVERGVKIFLQDNYIRPMLDDSAVDLNTIVNNVTNEKWVTDYIKNRKSNKPTTRVIELDADKLQALAKNPKALEEYLKSRGITLV